MRCGIIGYGRFGKLWAKCLADIGQEVLVYDRKGTKRKEVEIKFVNDAEVLKAELLFLLVPISEMENVCRKIAGKLEKNTIVIDACSVKVFPAGIMKKNLARRQPIIATHPLFGPDSVARFGLAGQNVVVCPLRITSGQLKKIEDLLKKMKLRIIHATPAEHDRQMAKSQTLVHFIGRGLEKLNLNEQLIATPDYHALLKMNAMVQNDTWQLFLDMQRLNPYARQLRGNLTRSLNILQTVLENDRNLKTLPELRKKINLFDREIIGLLKKRFDCAAQIGKIKKSGGLAVEDKTREEKLLRQYTKMAAKKNLSDNLTKQVFKLIFTESKKLQRK